MRISKVVLRNFKRFQEETFHLGDHVVLAGPNNSGKTTLLQAIGAWSLALGRWHELGDSQRRSGGYTKQNLNRLEFYPVPMRSFDLMWHDRKYKKGRIEIEVTSDAGHIPIELQGDTDSQIYARPSKDADREVLKKSKHFPKCAFVPPMSGLEIDEPVLQQPRIDQLMGFGKPGDVLRNLLVEVSYDPETWRCLTAAVGDIFGYELLPPIATGPLIVAEYRQHENGPAFDINSAGSGFLQMLMLLTFMCTRKDTVLLLDTPDAHLHVILQDTIYSTLKTFARENGTQLIIATHSRTVINSVEPRELLAMTEKPQKLADNNEKSALIQSLSLPNTDLMLALEKGCILYTEGHTDLSILLAWAAVLSHRLKDFLEHPLWRPAVYEPRTNAPGISAEDHFGALLLMQDNMRGAAILDRDGRAQRPTSKLERDGKLLKLCWTRYEIESYLLHPDALARFVEKNSGVDAALANVEAMRKAMRVYLPDAAVDSPLLDDPVFISTKARTSFLQKILDDAELQGLHYSRYNEIAAVMHPEEIHPEVTRFLDSVANHFDL